MKEILFFMLILFSSPTFAAWELLGRGGDGSDFYFDSDTAVRNGNKVKIWIMQNYDSAELLLTNEKYLSMVVLYVYECKEKTLQIASVIFYEKNNGKGKVVSSQSVPENERQKMDVIPNTTGSGVWKIACGKK